MLPGVGSIAPRSHGPRPEPTRHAAFDEAYERHRRRVFGFLLRLTRSTQLAEDLLQNTWLKLSRNAQRLSSDTNLVAWLFTVARNEARSQQRWSRLDASIVRGLGSCDDAGSGDPTPFDRASASEEQRRLEVALAMLPVSHREVLLLVGVEGLEQEAAADVLGISPPALRQRISRARAQLRKILDARCADREGEIT